MHNQLFNTRVVAQALWLRGVCVVHYKRKLAIFFQLQLTLKFWCFGACILYWISNHYLSCVQGGKRTPFNSYVDLVLVGSGLCLFLGISSNAFYAGSSFFLSSHSVKFCWCSIMTGGANMRQLFLKSMRRQNTHLLSLIYTLPRFTYDQFSACF